MLSLFLFAGFTFVIGKAQDHEIVYPRMIISRSGEKRVFFRAFDRDFRLRLEPVDALTDDLVVHTTNDNGEEVFYKPNVDNLRETILQDPNVGATISIDDNGPLKIKGVINEKLRIEPDVSSHHKGGHHGGHYGKEGKKGKYGGKGKYYGKYMRQYDEFSEGIEQEREDSMEQIPHRVYEVTQRINDPRFFDDEIMPLDLKYNLSNEKTIENRADIIIVEVAVVSDVEHSKMLGSNDDCAVYHVILMNSVNLRFQTMKKTNIRFVLTDIVRNQPGQQSYIDGCTVDGHALSSETLYALCKHVYDNPTKFQADIVHLITKTPLGDLDKSTNEINPGVIGIAFVGAACNRRYKCGISEDDGSCFSGSSTIAHENGHLLGCSHDGDPCAYDGCPGSTQCSWNNGYIMSYVRNNEYQYAFSSCCDDCVSYFASLRSSSCLSANNTKRIVNVYDNRLSGTFLKEKWGTTTPESYYDIKCKNARDGWFIYKYFPGCCIDAYYCRTAADSRGSFYYWKCNAEDGDPCDKNKHCENGYCVDN